MKVWIFAIIAAFAFSTTATAQDCPFENGQMIETQSYSDVFEKLNQISVDKDEFETTEEYKQRIEIWKFGNPTLIESQTDSEYTRYEADEDRFVVTDSFFDASEHWFDIYDAIPKVYHRGSGNPFDNQITGTLVNRHEQYYSGNPSDLIFEGINSTGYSRRSKEWLFDKDFYKWRPDSTITDQVVFVDVPRDQAEEIVDLMRVAYYVVPKPPFKLEVSTTERVLFADIHCVLITDPDGVVLRVVDRNTKKKRKERKKRRKEKRRAEKENNR